MERGVAAKPVQGFYYLLVSVLSLAFGIARWEKNQTKGAGWSWGCRIQTRREIACVKGVVVVEKMLERVHSCLTIDAVKVTTSRLSLIILCLVSSSCACAGLDFPCRQGQTSVVWAGWRCGVQILVFITNNNITLYGWRSMFYPAQHVAFASSSRSAAFSCFFVLFSA